MLNTEAPFPQPGSFALILVDPDDPARAAGDRVTSVQATAYVAVRILRHAGAGIVASLLAVPGASGQRTVPANLLRDATPLTPAEAAELAALDARLTGKARRRRADETRADALRERAELAPILARQRRRAEALSRDRDAIDRRAYA
jgi:hypothetical protein